MRIVDWRKRYRKLHPPAIFPQPYWYYLPWNERLEHLESIGDFDFQKYLGVPIDYQLKVPTT